MYGGEIEWDLGLAVSARFLVPAELAVPYRVADEVGVDAGRVVAVVFSLKKKCTYAPIIHCPSARAF